MVFDAIVAMVVVRRDNGNCLALGARQAGTAEQQMKIQVAMGLQCPRVETVYLQNVGNFAALRNNVRVQLAEFALCLTLVCLSDRGHERLSSGIVAGEQQVWIAERFELQGIAAWIANEKRRLFARLIGKSHAWANKKFHLQRLQPVAQTVPLVPV